MVHLAINCAPSSRRVPWNKGKFTGPKPPLKAKHVWAIRAHLGLSKKVRDLALFNVAIDSKLRGCDVVALKVNDIAPHGCTANRATVRQQKTGRPVKFELTEPTREAVDAYLKSPRRPLGEYLFPGNRGRDKHLTARQYARLVDNWLTCIGLDRSLYGTHSLGSGP